MQVTYEIPGKRIFREAGFVRDSAGPPGPSTPDRGELARPYSAPTLPAPPGGQTTGARPDAPARLLAAPLLNERSQALLALEEGRLLAWLRANPARDSLWFLHLCRSGS